jgi:hypothetical protein
MNNEDLLSRDDVDAAFRALRTLKASFGLKPNKDDVTVTLIGACITEGFDTERRIIGALRRLNIHEAHVRALLRYHTGDDPERHLWREGKGGRYVMVLASACVAD